MTDLKKDSSPAAFIRRARLELGLNQKDFGKRIGKEQSQISRYEREETDPPASVIMQCMHILKESEDTKQKEVGLDDLVAAIRSKLTTPSKSKARSLLFDLLHTLA